MKTNIIAILKFLLLPIMFGIIMFFGFDYFVNIISKNSIERYERMYPPNKATEIISTNMTDHYNPAYTGPIGDTYGGLLGPIIAIVAAFLTFLAFYVQYFANEQQKNYLKQQRFEDTFFRLLENHQKIVDSMDLKKKDHTPLSNSRDCFRTMHIRFKRINDKEVDFEKIIENYDKVQDWYKNDLHHYFRFLYHILKFIKTADIKQSEKFRYASILRATLSPYELAFIFYNGLHEFGNSHFKPLLEEYSFLKNMDDKLLLNVLQKSEYDDLTFASSEDRKLLYNPWKTKQRKKLKWFSLNFSIEY